MEAKVQRRNGVTVVNLKGFIDVETAIPFRDACIKSLGQANTKVVFNLEGLNFVGSNGIIPFVETLHDLCDQEAVQIKFCKVSAEFQKIFKASPLRDVEIFSDENGAILSLSEVLSEPAS